MPWNRPSSAFAAAWPRSRQMRNTVTSEVAATHSQARRRPSRQPVSSACALDSRCTYSCASSTGFADVLVGAPNFTTEQWTNEGRAYLYLGGPAGLAAQPAWFVDPIDDVERQFARSLAGVGDVSGDGYDDVIAGAPGWQREVLGEGRTFLFLGGGGGLAGEPSGTADPTDSVEAKFGTVVAKLGDADGDGFGDILISASLEHERTYMFSGNGSSLAADAAWVVSDRGTALAGGDVNGDGYDDALVSGDDGGGGGLCTPISAATRGWSLRRMGRSAHRVGIGLDSASP